MRWFLLALVVALAPMAASTPAAADSRSWNLDRYLSEPHSWGTITINTGPDVLTLDWSGLVLGDQASKDLRGVADGALSGKKDGTVDAKERDDVTFALKAFFESSFAKAANNHAFSGLVLIDQAEAQKVTVTSLTADGLTGPVDGDTPVAVTVGLKIDFPNIDDHKDVHTVKVDLGDAFVDGGHDDQAAKLVGDLTLRVGTVPDWTLDRASVQPACAADRFDNGVLVFHGDDVPCFTGTSGVLLTFAIDGHGRSSNVLPGVGLAAVVAALALALVRRRQ